MAMMSYDRVKIALCLTTAGTFQSFTTISLMKLMGVLSQTKLWPESSSQEIMLLMRDGSCIAANRERLVLAALEANATHILFVDADMNFEPDAVATLASRRLAIVGCNYRKRQPPAPFTAVHLDRSRGLLQTTATSAGLEPVDFMGLGLCLIEAGVFRATPRPWFAVRFENEDYTTEDKAFFDAARAAGFVAYVDQYASKRIGHVGWLEYRWDQSFDGGDHA